MRQTSIAFLGLFLFTSAAAGSISAKKQFELWGTVKKPLAGEPDPIGTYTAGCLGGAKTLPLDGAGYSVMRPSRLRYFGHERLVNYIEGLGKKLQEAKLPRLLVGDMGRPRGGPMPSGHASHQIGLDVDLWYDLSVKKPTLKQRESRGASAFVNLKNNELSPAWGERERKLVALAAEPEDVERVFVHPTIKRDLCEKFADAPWLYKVRAWWAHHDHLHARLRCPPGSAHCTAQEPLDPKNKGCGEELAWWFSEEAKEEGRKKAAAFAGREFPELPPACAQMVPNNKKEGGKL